MRRFRSLTLLLASGVLLVGGFAEAQQAGGSAVRGRAVDAQQGVLPGVAIVATHMENGTFRETTTGPDGTYFITGIVPGPYRITAELQGFRRFTQDVRLQIGETTTVDLRLEVGALTESVTVTAEAPLVDITSTQVAGNVTSAEMTELPSANRSVMGFVALLPGVQYNPSAIGPGSVVINGQHGSQVIYVIDGGNNNDDMRGGGAGPQARPALETIQEFQVITNQYDAEYGRGSGGIVNAITRQGTNNLRGSAFGFFTNSSLTAPSFFAKQQNLARPDTSKRQWGGTIGGPIIRDRTHFFASFEAVNVDEGLSRVYPSRPDMSFSDVVYSNFWNTLARLDHQVNGQNTFAFRYLGDYQPIRNRSGVGFNPGGVTDENQTLTALQDEWDLDQTGMFTYNRVFGGTRLNTIRAAITQEDVDRGTPAYRKAGGDMLVQPPTLRHVSFDTQSTDFALHRIQTSYQFDESFSWFMPGRRGDHDLKMGLQYVWADHRQVVQHALNGIFTFPSDRAFNAADPSTYPERLSVRVPAPELPYVFTHSIALFAQDKWRVTNNLTLNLGVRYDVEIAPIEERFNPLFSDPNDHPVDWNNLQPRVGFAYSLGRESVVRAGYGMFYEKLWTDRFEPYVRQGVFAQSFVTEFPVDRPDPGPSQGRLPSEPLLQNGPVVNRDRLAQLFPSGTLARNNGAVFLDTPDRRIPYSHQVSMGYERQLGGQLSYAADYVHSWGRDQVFAYDLNPAVRVDTSRTGRLTRFDLRGVASQLGLSPFSNNVWIRENIGRSAQDVLSVQLEKRFSNFWGARASYSIGSARGHTDGSPDAINNFQVLEERNLDLNWGPLAVDRKHLLTLSGRVEVPGTGGVTVSAVHRFMSGRPINMINSAVDADRNGRLFDPLPPGTYRGTGQNAIEVKNKGGRNGARGPTYSELDLRVGYRLDLGGVRTLDMFAEVFNVTDEPNFSNPTGDLRSGSFLRVGSLFGGGIPRQLQVGVRLGF
ncbi:MAG: TonB-dependent receptor [Acidobacteria bacterium]|nr:TonB-dependent receptor [Acidobacteriota bacterium]